jgi:glycosyltransferase involved in cell wall biosynthesis
VSDLIGPPFPSPPAGRSGWPWSGGSGASGLEPPSRDESAPRITVITPSFNQGEFLEETIRSVVLQDHPNVEYIVIDGGSTDHSVSIIKRYEPWISQWVSETDNGQADAINKGFERATGELLCWLNADDVLYQGFLSRRREELTARPEVDLIYGDVESGWDGATRAVLRGEAMTFIDMLRTLRVAIPQQSAMWRRSTIERLGGLDPRWHVVLDREFFLRVVHRGMAEYVPGLCGYFRQHRSAKSVAETKVWVTELPLMYEEFFADPHLELVVRRLQRETMANVHLLCFDILRAAREWRGALVQLGKAVGWSPGHAAMSFSAARFRAVRDRLHSGKPNELNR